MLIFTLESPFLTHVRSKILSAPPSIEFRNSLYEIREWDDSLAILQYNNYVYIQVIPYAVMWR